MLGTNKSGDWYQNNGDQKRRVNLFADSSYALWLLLIFWNFRIVGDLNFKPGCYFTTSVKKSFFSFLEHFILHHSCCAAVNQILLMLQPLQVLWFYEELWYTSRMKLTWLYTHLTFKKQCTVTLPIDAIAVFPTCLCLTSCCKPRLQQIAELKYLPRNVLLLLFGQTRQ